MGLSVIGAGFGRTGTRSLKAALEELGFGKCYHMVEVFKNPGHMNMWTEVIETGRSNWASIFEGFQAVMDWPASVYYKTLMAAFPDAKVILTVRDPELWYESIRSTFYARSKKYGRFLIIIPTIYRFFKALEKVLWQGIFNSRLEDKTYAINIFNEHIEEVKRSVPGDRLLIFEARQGWEPLCEFLDVPVPRIPYPHVNKGQKYGTGEKPL
jgi:hypothetical protein